MGRTGCFSGELKTVYHEDLKMSEVLEPFWFVRPNGEPVPAPKGMMTDFASTPFGVRNLFPQFGSHNRAAVIHDFLYQGEFVPRVLADKVFKEALEAIEQVPRWKIPIMYWGVRVGGGATYFQHTKLSIHRACRLARVSNNGCRPLWKDGNFHFV